MADQIKEYCGEELSTFQLKRVIRAMAQKYPMPITAYLSDVVKQRRKGNATFLWGRENGVLVECAICSSFSSRFRSRSSFTAARWRWRPANKHSKAIIERKKLREMTSRQ